nr:MAG TPA: Protein of unknown function (DUF1040) [Caudoviricetes sp.]
MSAQFRFRICEVNCLRDPQRIPALLARVQTAWAKMPEQRFGQLILNYFHWLEEHQKVPFYMEDEELVSQFEAYVAIFTEI